MPGDLTYSPQLFQWGQGCAPGPTYACGIPNREQRSSHSMLQPRDPDKAALLEDLRYLQLRCGAPAVRGVCGEADAVRTTSNTADAEPRDLGGYGAVAGAHESQGTTIAARGSTDDALSEARRLIAHLEEKLDDAYTRIWSLEKGHGSGHGFKPECGSCTDHPRESSHATQENINGNMHAMAQWYAAQLAHRDGRIHQLEHELASSKREAGRSHHEFNPYGGDASVSGTNPQGTAADPHGGVMLHGPARPIRCDGIADVGSLLCRPTVLTDPFGTFDRGFGRHQPRRGNAPPHGPSDSPNGPGDPTGGENGHGQSQGRGAPLSPWGEFGQSIYELRMERNLHTRKWPQPWEWPNWLTHLKHELTRMVAPHGRQVLT